MEIVEEEPDFTSNLEFQFYTRRDIIMRLVGRIVEATDICKIEAMSPCTHRKNFYFVYNNIAKVYFEHYPKTNGIKLWNFAFNTISSVDDLVSVRP